MTSPPNVISFMDRNFADTAVDQVFMQAREAAGDDLNMMRAYVCGSRIKVLA